jgi:hypothetical protein
VVGKVGEARNVPFCGDVGEELRKLLDLDADRGEVEFSREEVCHLQEE